MGDFLYQEVILRFSLSVDFITNKDFDKYGLSTEIFNR